MKFKETHILVLGGGYAGIVAALRTAGKTKRQKTRVTLVSGLDRFVERPRLHEEATGAQIEQTPLRDMLAGSRVTFQQGWVRRIDPDTRQVFITGQSGKKTLAYDTLILALGSRVARHGVPGVEKHAYTLDPFGRLSTAALKDRLKNLELQPFRAVVVGGGATGIEMATQLRGTHPTAKVTLVSYERAGGFKGARVHAHIAAALEEQAIEVIEGEGVTAVRENEVETATRTLPADVIIWAGGFAASPLAREAGLATNGRGQVLTDPFLRSISHPDIYAVGDMASPVEEPGAPMRMSLFTAVVTGAQAADNIAAASKAKTPRPLSFAWYGQGITLGPNDAVGFGTYPDDVPSGPILRGRLAVGVRNFFVRFLKGALEWERRVPGILFWNGKKRYEKNLWRRQPKQPKAARPVETIDRT